MLNGIGGRTVAEAKASMSMSEAMRWVEYVRRRGGLNINRRLEVGLAQVQLLMCRMAGDSKSSLDDFMPHEIDRDEKEAAVESNNDPISFEALTAMLSATAPKFEEQRKEKGTWLDVR